MTEAARYRPRGHPHSEMSARRARCGFTMRQARTPRARITALPDIWPSTATEPGPGIPPPSASRRARCWLEAVGGATQSVCSWQTLAAERRTRTESSPVQCVRRNRCSSSRSSVARSSGDSDVRSPRVATCGPADIELLGVLQIHNDPRPFFHMESQCWLNGAMR